MSYSFQFVIQTKDQAAAKLAEEFDKVVEVQPIHARDRQAATGAALALLDLLADEPEKDIQVSVNGSVSWPWQAEQVDQSALPLVGVTVGASAYHVERKT